jgi:cytochrome b subunit of formate dehydrogenase
MSKMKIIRCTHWFLTIFIIFYIITGFGISNNQLIKAITFDLITKPIAFQLHSFLIYPFVALLFIHILLTLKFRK